jgi:hypothetical protein
MSKSPSVSPAKAKERLWRMGHLSWLMDKNQQDLYNLFHTNPAKIQTWLLARRSGKSYTLCVLAIEYCLSHPKSIIKYICPYKKQVERTINPIIEVDILSNGCPEDLKPKYHKKEELWFFPNGSQLQLCGSEAGNIDSIRGGFAHICIVDEAQDVSNLNYAIKSVLLPTTLTTKGKILMSGTPPQDPDHEFVGFIEKANAEKTLIKRTIYDNPRLTAEDIKLQSDAMGGLQTEDFRREFLCELIKSKTRSVLPEVTEDLLKEIVKEWPRPPYFDSYTSMDVGLKDWTVLLFAYYDFRNDKVVIEDEVTAYGPDMHLPVLTESIREKELELWTSPLTNEFIKPKKRISDHNLIVINEIKKFSNYEIFFELADKREKMAGINWLRTLFASGKVIINPRCVTLIRHIKDAKWASTTDKDTFSKCPMGSHYDAVDALVYLVKAIDFKSNPYPKDFNNPLPSDAFRRPHNNGNGLASSDVYRKILNLRKGK